MYSFVAAVARGGIGAAIGCAIGLAGTTVGYFRALIAPPDSPPQALLQPGAYSISIRFCLGFIIAGSLLGALWPIGRRRDGSTILLGALVGAVLLLIIAPAMNTALPNWPIEVPRLRDANDWVTDVIGGAFLGGVVGWMLGRPITDASVEQLGAQHNVTGREDL